MNTYDPSQHPRAKTGEFTDKHRDEPGAGSLTSTPHGALVRLTRGTMVALPDDIRGRRNPTVSSVEDIWKYAPMTAQAEVLAEHLGPEWDDDAGLDDVVGSLTRENLLDLTDDPNLEVLR